MKILMHTGGIAATNCYLVADESSKRAVLFDAPDGTVAPLMDEAERQGWDLVGLWLTHGHFDHLADHAAVTARFPGAKVLIHPLDEPKLRNPELMRRIFPLPFTIPPRSADAHVTDGQTLHLGAIPLTVIHTPGHAPGHVAYHFPTEKVVIGGDLILMNGVGRTDLPDSDPSALPGSLRRLMQLPDDTRLLAGHGEPSTIGGERRANPYVIEALSES